MKKVDIIKWCSTVGLLISLTDTAYAFDMGDMRSLSDPLKKSAQALQTGKSITSVPTTAISPAAVDAGASSGLTGMLMQQLGISQPQAQGGAGAIFQMAKSKMEGAAFSKLSSSVPGMQGLLAAAPIANPASGSGLGGLAGLAGNQGGGVGGMLGLVSAFQQLGLAPDMVQKFVPLVVQYVQGTGGSGVSGLLQSAVMGGL